MSDPMRWRDATLVSLQQYAVRHQTRVITRKEFIDEEMATIQSATQTKGDTPEQTLSRVFQNLRDDGILEFSGPGRYLLLNQPIDIELEDLESDEIDLALRASRLQLGMVATSIEAATVRQRRGQDRIRALTLINYGNCCALCDIADESLLVASHIIGWAEAPEIRGSLANVICLCRIHYALFERGFWSLSDEYFVLKKPSSSEFIAEILNFSISLRTPTCHKPDLEFLRRHRLKFGY